MLRACFAPPQVHPVKWKLSLDDRRSARWPTVQSPVWRDAWCSSSGTMCTESTPERTGFEVGLGGVARLGHRQSSQGDPIRTMFAARLEAKTFRVSYKKGTGPPARFAACIGSSGYRQRWCRLARANQGPYFRGVLRLEASMMRGRETRMGGKVDPRVNTRPTPTTLRRRSVSPAASLTKMLFYSPIPRAPRLQVRRNSHAMSCRPRLSVLQFDSSIGVRPVLTWHLKITSIANFDLALPPVAPVEG